MDIDLLVTTMREIAEKEIKEIGGEFVFEDLPVPDRWFRETGLGHPLMRCTNNHVSASGLQQDEGGIVCLECFGETVWTFPEDKDGPLKWHE